MKDLAVSNNINSLINSETIKKRFKNVIGEKAPQFLSSLMTVVNNNKDLKNCEPISVLSASMIAASLDLDILPTLNFASIVPYGNKAQFQIMTNGIIQLAQRSGQFKYLNADKLYKDEIGKYDRIKGTVEILGNSKMREDEKEEDVAGYFCYFQLLNGFEKFVYWTVKEIKAHGKKYSKSFDNPNGLWKTNFDAMARKTLIKNTLLKFAPLSPQMKMAVISDQGTFENIDKAESVEPEYIDNES